MTISQSVQLGFLIFILGCAAPKNVMIHQSNDTRLGPCEPTIYINPANPQQVVAGSVLNFYHTSNDGGVTWETGALTSSLGVYGDPCIVADQEGRFYYFHLADPEHKGWASDRLLECIVSQRSDDGGKTWTEGSAIGIQPPKDQDKEWAVINPENNEIYVTWTQFDKYGDPSETCESNILFARSSNLGESWSSPIQVSNKAGNCIDDDNTTEGAVPAVGPNGEIYVAWSFDEKIYFDKSTTGGYSWMDEDLVISDHVGGWNIDVEGLGRTNGMPITVCDLSKGENRGNLYVCWGGLRNGLDNGDIFLSRSEDSGKTWSTPVKVNQDKTNTHQFLPWMAIDQTTGNLHIVFYDRSKHKDTQTDVVIASSKDGGQSFKQQTISEKPFTPPGKDVFFGDYNNISAHGGMIRPIWTAYYDGKLSVWTALVKE